MTENQKPLDPLRNVPRVPAVEVIEGEKTPDGRAVQYDENGKAYADSSPQTGGIRTYLDEAEYPPLQLEIAPPALKVTPQAAPTAASAFAPAPPEELDPRAALQTSAETPGQAPIMPEVHAAPAAGVPSFSSTQVTDAQQSHAATTTDKTQAVIDATKAHPAAQPGGAK